MIVTSAAGEDTDGNEDPTIGKWRKDILMIQWQILAELQFAICRNDDYILRGEDSKQSVEGIAWLPLAAQ